MKFNEPVFSLNFCPSRIFLPLKKAEIRMENIGDGFPRGERLDLMLGLLNSFMLFDHDFGLLGANFPRLVKRKIFCSKLLYRDRGFLAAFAFQNGIHIDWLLEVIAFVNPAFNQDRGRKIKAVWDWFHGEEQFLRRCQYFAYHLGEGRVLDLNRHVRHDDVEVAELSGAEGDAPNAGPRIPGPRVRDNAGYHC